MVYLDLKDLKVIVVLINSSIYKVAVFKSDCLILNERFTFIYCISAIALL